MSLRNTRELQVTRAKLRLLEEKYADLKGQPAADAHVRELSLRSLKVAINRLTEEIALFESRVQPAAEDK